MIKATRLLGPICFGLSLGTAAAQSRPDAPCGSEVMCSSSLGPNARRLHDAFLSSATSDQHRAKMREYIIKHTAKGSTNWSFAADEYFAWYMQATGYKPPSPSSSSSNKPAASNGGLLDCPTNKPVTNELSISKIAALIPDYEGKYVRITGRASGNVYRNQRNGELWLNSFSDLNRNTSIIDIRLVPETAREWLKYTQGDGNSEFRATLILGIRGGSMYALKICGYYTDGTRSFEGTEMSFSQP